MVTDGSLLPSPWLQNSSPRRSGRGSPEGVKPSLAHTQERRSPLLGVLGYTLVDTGAGM